MLECFSSGRTSEEHLIKAICLLHTYTHTHHMACHEWAVEDIASEKSLLSRTAHIHILRLSRSQSPGNNISQTNTHSFSFNLCI